jgi:hypothetical protein
MNSDKAREQMINSHIKRKYCPVIEKMTILQLMLEKAIATSDSGIRYINMMTSKINYTLAMIALYTDLKIDNDEDGKGRNLDDYDTLVESGVVGVICAAIGEQEMQEFSNVNAMLISNFERSEGSFEVYLGRAIEGIKQRVNDITDLMQDPAKLQDIVESLNVIENIKA